MTIPSKILVRTDTAANWATANPVLAAGEPAWVRDSKIFAIGDGVAPFATLTKFKNAAQVDASAAAAAASAAAAAADRTAVAAALGSLSPSLLAAPGALVMFPATTAPPGYLKANGATGLLRADFPALWAFIQGSGLLAASEGAKQPHQFGPGNGTTTFSLIDARGYALRAWDDGRGVDAGRGIGTYQQDQFQDHAHGGAADTHGGHTHAGSFSDTHGGHTHTINDPGHSHGINALLIAAGGVGIGGSGTGQVVARATDGALTGITGTNGGGAHSHNLTIAGGGSHTHQITISTATTGNRGAETRGKNVAYLVCIKF